MCADVVRETSAQQRFGEAQVPGNALATLRVIALARRAAPQARGLTGVEHHEGRQPSESGQVRTREHTVSEREAAVARKLFIERSVTGVVNDVVSSRFEFRGHARERRGVAGDFGQAHRLAAPEQVRYAFALALGAGEITGRIRDQQHTEFALLTPSGVESCRHQVGGCVTP